MFSIAHATEAMIYSCQATGSELAVDTEGFHKKSLSAASMAFFNATAALNHYGILSELAEHDIALIERHGQTNSNPRSGHANLLSTELNSQNDPFLLSMWGKTRDDLLDLDASFEVWIDWYEARLKGARFDRKWEESCLNLAEEKTSASSAEINAYLSSLATGQTQNSLDDVRNVSDIPTQQPAAIAPFVAENGRLTVSAEAAALEFPEATLDGLLAALKAELIELAHSISTATNVDARMCDIIRQTSDLIPDDRPTTMELFRLGHRHELLVAYENKALSEWPDVASKKFLALNQMFNRVLLRFPEWRNFVGHASELKVEAIEPSDARELAAAFSEVLDDAEMVCRSATRVATVFPTIGRRSTRYGEH